MHILRQFLSPNLKQLIAILGIGTFTTLKTFLIIHGRIVAKVICSFPTF